MLWIVFAAVTAEAIAKHPRITFYGKGRTFYGATGYCTGSITASGRVPRSGFVAVLPGDPWDSFGTRFYVTRVNGRSVDLLGRRTFRIEDHIGSGSELDFWVVGGSCDGFGRNTIRAYRYVWQTR